MNDFRQSEALKISNKNKSADFADALIVNRAKFYTSKHNKNLKGLYTFDKAALELTSTKSP